MPLYSQDIIDRVNASVDLVELISPYVSLRKAGASYKGLCPFHAEKTPSFMVTPHRRMFYCFGCHSGGGPINFLMKIADLSFPEALEELARRGGIDLPEPSDFQAEGQSRPRINRAAIYEVLSLAAKFYQQILWSPEGESTRRYLVQRGLSQRAARDFGLGLSPTRGWGDLVKHLAAAGFSESLMVQAGVVKESNRKPGNYYDLFRARLMVPIFDQPKQVVGFGGRRLVDDPDQPKYINSPETPVFKKNRTLYGLSRARPFLKAAEMAFIVEGYFDLISLVDAGVNEVVAPLGTALTTNQVEMLGRLIKEAVLVFDGDAAGQKATSRALPMLLNAELDGRVLVLPKGHDPDSFIREFGVEAWYEAASQAVDIIDFQVAHLKNAHPNSPAGQARMLREARELLAEIPDSAKSQLLRRRLARLLGLDEELLGAPKASAPKNLKRPAKGKAPRADFDLVAGQLLRHLLIHEEIRPMVLTEMAAWWPQDASRAVFDRLRKQMETSGHIDPASALPEGQEALNALISKAAFTEREFPPDESEAVASDLMARLKNKWRKTRQAEISQAIAQAQFQGDETEVLRLMEEKKSLT